ncbi:MAG: LEA type 2 family protein [Treponema sp.]|nr:LEA type 2 family protein [Treponema sp.]
MKNRRVCAVLAALLLAAGSCRNLQSYVAEPKVSLESVSLAGISFEGVDMIARVNVENSGAFTIPFPEIDWELFINGASFLKGTIRQGAPLKAASTTVVEIPCTVPYRGLYDSVKSLANADEAVYRVALGARFPLPLLENKTFTAEFSGSLPLLKMPALSFDGITFNSLSLSKIEVVLNWTVENKNAFAINLDSLRYDFRVNNSSWVSGSTPRQLSLPAKRATRVPVTVSINSLAIIRDIVALAAGGKSVTYNCGGEAALSPVFTGLAPLKLPFNANGTTTLK